MLKLRQARGTFNKGLSALSAFSRNETIFFSKDAVPALPCPGALACRPAVRHSQRLEPSPSSFRLSSRQNLSLRHQSSSSPGTFCQSLGGEGWDTLTMGPCFLVFSTIQGKTRANLPCQALVVTLLRGCTIATIKPIRQASTCGRVLAPSPTPSAPINKLS